MPDKITKRSRAVGSKPPKQTAAEKLAQKQAKEAAEKANSSLAKTDSNSTTATYDPAKSSSKNQASNGAVSSLEVPGLKAFGINEISGHMPSDFKVEAFKVTDSLKPPATIPQVSEADFETSQSIYKDGIRAAKLFGLGFDLSKETFITEGKKADAYGAGIQAATKFEKVRGDYYDYQSQLEKNQQKSTDLGVAQHTTTQGRQKAVYENSITDSQLELARIASEKAKADTRDKQKKLDEILKQLGEVA